MRLKRYTQGEQDQELFGLLGALVTNTEVHAQLGYPVTSREGDLWHVALNGEMVSGFASARVLKSHPHAHLRFLYAPDPTVREMLLDAVLADPAVVPLEFIYTNDRETSVLWATRGFTSSPVRKNWCFVRWEKRLR